MDSPQHIRYVRLVRVDTRYTPTYRVETVWESGRVYDIVATSQQYEKVVDIGRLLASWAGVPFVDQTKE